MTRKHAAIAVFTAALASVAAWSFAAGEGEGFVQGAVLNGLSTPSDVAAFEGGWVVADAAAGAVVAFDASGAERWRATGLDHPSGLAVRDGAVVVAEEGASRVATVRDGLVTARLGVADAPTDLAPAADGQLWMSAAPSGLLVWIDGTGAVTRSFDLGMRAPRALEPDGADGVWVADALGGGIAHLDATGAVLAQLGGWGAGEGLFLKPKGLAVLADGGLAVADSHQGIVQILHPDGSFSRVVSTADGPWAFEHPLGIAILGQRMAVTDASAGHVLLLDPSGPAFLGGHFPEAEWLFRPSPVHDPDPSVTCRQCHDGTKSAHLEVWDPSAHAHPIGGETALACTSCHRLHSPDPVDDPEVIRGVVAQREAAGPVVRQCASCHAAALGATRSSGDVGHPVGQLPAADADIAGLLADGAVFEDGAVGCQTCHRPHGASHADLLVRAVDDGALCLSCHAAQHPSRSSHPVLVKATPEARASVDRLGGTLGPKGELVCVSCHDPHGAEDRHLLRASGTSSACRGCHTDQAQPIATGAHGALGCAQCHGMHSGKAPTQVAGTCQSCHAEEASGPRHVQRGGAGSCTSCHDPHGSGPDLPRKACTDCHSAIAAAIAGGSHDASTHPVRGSTGTCTSCHDPHGEPGAYLIASAGPGNPATARCLACHDGSSAAPTVTRWVHPKALLVATQLAAGERSPYAAPSGEPAGKGQLGEITCRTCHQPHAPGPPTDVVRWCADCHGDDAGRRVSGFHTLAGEGA